MSNLSELQRQIKKLTYEEMMIFASWFAGVDVPDDDRNNDAFWSFIIIDWANHADLTEDEAEAKP